MINLLLGPPGGGKSYEATVFHVLPALAKGRKVITNLPLDIERISQIDISYIDLIEIRTENRIVDLPPPSGRFGRVGMVDSEKRIVRPFGSPEDYGDTWRHPDKGFGPLYVIDECHICLPRGKTPLAIDEWFSLHRHETADVLLITQSHGKVSKSIIDLVQVCYRVKKATAFGSNSRYIRKVQDGVNGDVVNTGIREYQKKYFGLYKSHTLGGGVELASNDIVPLWKRWPFVGAGIFGILFLIMLAYALSDKSKPFIPVSNSVQTASLIRNTPVQTSPVQISPPPSTSVVSLESSSVPDSMPFSSVELHIRTFVKFGDREGYSFQATQNGQHVFYLAQNELQESGYKVIPLSPCSVKLVYDSKQFFVTCDGARQEMINHSPVSAASGKKAAQV